MGSLIIRVLPVGQADCILICFPDKSWGVVDCGSSEFGSAGWMALATLQNEDPKGTPVRFVLVTHPDRDHCADVPRLLNLSSRWIEAVYHCGARTKRMPGVAAQRLAMPDVAEALSAKGKIGAVRQLGAGDLITWDPPCVGLSLVALNPEKETVPAEVRSGRMSNEFSVVLQITFGERRILLAGDVEGRGWVQVVGNREFYPPHVLKVSHHGATSGHPPEEVFDDVGGDRWALLSTASKVIDKPHYDVLKSFWRREEWTTRCTGWAPHCATSDQTSFPVPMDDARYPESLRIALQYGVHGGLFLAKSIRLGCCVDNRLEIRANGKIEHAIGSRTCDLRRS